MVEADSVVDGAQPVEGEDVVARRTVAAAVVVVAAGEEGMPEAIHQRLSDRRRRPSWIWQSMSTSVSASSSQEDAKVGLTSVT